MKQMQEPTYRKVGIKPYPVTKKTPCMALGEWAHIHITQYTGVSFSSLFECKRICCKTPIYPWQSSFNNRMELCGLC